MATIKTDSSTSTSDNDGLTKKFFNNYYNKEISYQASEVDAVIGYFLKRGFEQTAAINTASVLLQQATVDNIKVFQLLDTLKGINDVQLSNVVAQILNLNRSKTSSIGYKNPSIVQLFDQRNIHRDSFYRDHV